MHEIAREAPEYQSQDVTAVAAELLSDTAMTGFVADMREEEQEAQRELDEEMEENGWGPRPSDSAPISTIKRIPIGDADLSSDHISDSDDEESEADATDKAAARRRRRREVERAFILGEASVSRSRDRHGENSSDSDDESEDDEAPVRRRSTNKRAIALDDDAGDDGVASDAPAPTPQPRRHASRQLLGPSRLRPRRSPPPLAVMAMMAMMVRHPTHQGPRRSRRHARRQLLGPSRPRPRRSPPPPAVMAMMAVMTPHPTHQRPRRSRRHARRQLLGPSRPRPRRSPPPPAVMAMMAVMTPHPTHQRPRRSRRHASSPRRQPPPPSRPLQHRASAPSPVTSTKMCLWQLAGPPLLLPQRPATNQHARRWTTGATNRMAPEIRSGQSSKRRLRVLVVRRSEGVVVGECLSGIMCVIWRCGSVCAPSLVCLVRWWFLCVFGVFSECVAGEWVPDHNACLMRSDVLK